MRTVGVYEAKTKFSQLLDEVEAGECVLITRSGKPVATLQKAEPAGRRSMAELARELRALRESQKPLGIPIKELIEEGRRF